MYYVWDKNMRLTSTFAHFDEEPDDYDIDVWTSGERLVHDPPHLILTTDEERPTLLSDLLLTSFDLLVFSPKLIQLFDRIGVQNISYYPVTVINHETGADDTNYNVAHIIEKISCLDIENSECRYSADGKDLMSVEEFSILEHKIKPRDKTGGKPLIFRLAEFEFIILVDELIKNECEKEGITGVKFIKPSEYV